MKIENDNTSKTKSTKKANESVLSLENVKKENNTNQNEIIETSKTPKVQNKKKPYKVPSALEGAFAVVIAQNAVILSRPIIDFAKNNRITAIHYLIISFALVNCFIVITNWVTCKTYYRANAALFCNDIITLTVIATIANIISGMFDPDTGYFNERFFFLISAGYYIVVHILFLWWNTIACVNTTKREQAVFRKQNLQNLVSITLSSILILFSLFEAYPFLCYASYTICVLYWVYILIMFTKTFNVSMH